MENTFQQSKKDKNTSNSIRSSKTSIVPERKLLKQSGSLEIFDANGASPQVLNNSRPPSQGSERSWSRASVGSVPPRPESSLSRRTVTPTKQVSLQAVRRKEENNDPFVDHVDWRSFNLDGESSNKAGASRRSKAGADVNISCEELNDKTKSDQAISLSPAGNISLTHKELKEEEKEEDEKEKKDSDEDDSDDEEEKRKAPNELLMEFVDCIIKKEFKVAAKLCKMILLYEPDNEEALKFKPLIEEKIQLDLDAENEETDDEAGDSDEEDDDDDEDDDSEDDSSTEEDSDEEDEEFKSLFKKGPDDNPGPSSESKPQIPRPVEEKPWPHSLRDSNMS